MFKWISSWFESEPVPQEIKNEIERTIKTHNVVVYSKTYCPYCTSTKSLLHQLNVPNVKIIELNLLDQGSTIQQGLFELSGQKTVPNVFINQKHIGGNSELQALNSQGKLKELLK